MTSTKSALIFGGNGGTARALTRLLTKNYRVCSVIRNLDQSSFLESLGAKTILQDLERANVDDLIGIIQDAKPDLIVWAAGAQAMAILHCQRKLIIKLRCEALMPPPLLV